MAAKKMNLNDLRGIVYSTDPNFQAEQHNHSSETLQPAMQALRVWLETKHRAGKAVTVVKGFVGREDDLNELGKKLKQTCGTGGAVKEGEVIIQGDHRQKVLQWLLKNGFVKAKAAGA